MMRRSTFSDGGPFSISVQTLPIGSRSALFTKREFGSMTVDQIC
jgi:hypothetical protein